MYHSACTYVYLNAVLSIQMFLIKRGMPLSDLILREEYSDDDFNRALSVHILHGILTGL